ncbi:MULTISPECIES: PAAR domain-containing protein [Paraburkholderia]|uniref:PAAR domain-containing protein n=1 Tax=Paraburkholderia TaxID=1822464 RepID=UPI00197DB854|nr:MULTISPECIES: PAAR domain-containing protein [Paraburkholderia]MBN3808137.1 PAAR domain-containing protein [Paraburkholderia sp. Ac-20347]
MKDEHGRGVIRLHDKTSHGGEVITACDEITAMGVPVALQDDLTWCPKCNGKFRIIPENSQRSHHGKPVAHHNDPTECGARLITSLSPD